MDSLDNRLIARRAFLAGTTAAGLLALPGCQSMGGFSMVDAIRRLLDISARNAFAKLTAPGGFWDSEVARFDLPEMFGASGGIRSLLTSAVFKQNLQKQLNVVAEKGAARAAPLVYEAVTNISIPDAVAIVRGGSSAATGYLRSQMGQGLVNAMVPGLSDALRISGDPVLGQAIRALSGVDVGQIAQSVATRADNSIWKQIGIEEGAIRAHPESTRDPLLIGVFKVL
ncbi:DUF4197 domain-containing protein [Novosphingobium sp.]|uniref:DUF4197 domain-containing protein n=1 Tax=Novosphingobium sp. TaxID=1874826 RepID=UPI0025F90613|nr:DUF4197 domain-containing protein [Novosphingobium sp.]MCC6924777.1 DUF4197 domain-containing protein [Novosphingobium sp.]